MQWSQPNSSQGMQITIFLYFSWFITRANTCCSFWTQFYNSPISAKRNPTQLRGEVNELLVFRVGFYPSPRESQRIQCTCFELFWARPTFAIETLICSHESCREQNILNINRILQSSLTFLFMSLFHDVELTNSIHGSVQAFSNRRSCAMRQKINRLFPVLPTKSRGSSWNTRQLYCALCWKLRKCCDPI